MTKILLVEDDKSLREIYSVRLLAEGYTLISSGDGEEALAAAISEKPDLIISDVMMPKISGFEMLDLLRSNDNTKNIPVIMLTALSSEQQRERGDRLGADRYLIKSQVGIEDIVRTVHEVLGDGGQKKNLDQLQSSVVLGSLDHTQGQDSSSNSNIKVNDPNVVNTTNAGASPSDQPSGTTSAATAESSTSTIIEPVVGNPSITGSNFPNMNQTTNATSSTTSPQEPANFQSAFNPPEATNPSAVIGRDSPQLPDRPMNIPSRTVQQPGMPASYTAATQSVANSPFSSLAHQPVRPRQTGSTTRTGNSNNATATPATPEAQSPNAQPSQPYQDQTTTGKLPNITAPQTVAPAANTSTLQTVLGQPANNSTQGASMQQPIAAATPTMAQPVQWAQQPAVMPMQPMVAQQAYYPQQAQWVAQQAPLPSGNPMAAQPSGQIQQPYYQQAPRQYYAQPGQPQQVQQQPNSDLHISGEKVITPPPASMASGPRINIDELLASAGSGTGSGGMFPAQTQPKS